MQRPIRISGGKDGLIGNQAAWTAPAKACQLANHQTAPKYLKRLCHTHTELRLKANSQFAATDGFRSFSFSDRRSRRQLLLAR